MLSLGIVPPPRIEDTTVTTDHAPEHGAIASSSPGRGRPGQGRAGAASFSSGSRPCWTANIAAAARLEAPILA